MKKNGKRQIKDYSKYSYGDPEYYGLVKKNKRVHIDVKRMMKTLSLPNEVFNEMNKPRKTIYFVPNKIYQDEYMINIFKNTIEELKRNWRDEIRPAMSKVKTPREAGERARTGYFMQTGILDYDECSTLGFFAAIKRESRYEYIMRTIIAQFIHQYISVIESVTIRVMTLKGYENDTFSRNDFNSFIQRIQSTTKNKKDIIKLEDLKYYQKYDRMYNVWHFLKHNSLDLYKKIKRKYPEMLYDYTRFSNGNLAMYALKIDTQFVNSLFENSILFFEELCVKIFEENLFYATWNYDKFFKRLVDDETEGFNNPLGLPPWT